MSYKVGDKVFLEGEVIEIDENATSYMRVMLVDGTENLFYETQLLPATKAYEDGLADAWELARKICGEANSKNSNLTGKQLGEIFSYSHSAAIMDNNTYQEALAKIEAYEKSQQLHRNEIVELPNRSLGVVTYADVQLDKYTVIDYRGRAKNDYNATQLKKTGRTVDIEHLLEQIRGNE